jgi:peptidoglycan/LPS O-acetylase OafA/YrhL
LQQLAAEPSGGAMAEASRIKASRTSQKLLWLEIIRFASAFAVLVWHYQHFTYVAATPTNFVRDHQPFYSLLKIFYDRGYYGVDIFWCISGFIFFWKYRDAIAKGLIGVRTFFVLRLSRLYPLHLATLLLVAMLQFGYFGSHRYFFVYQHNDFRHFLLQLTMASNWVHAHNKSFNAPIWSISLEILAYAIFFMVLRFLGRSILINVAILVLCSLAQMANLLHPIVECVAFFYAGGFAAIVSQTPTTNLQKAALKGLAIFILAIAPITAWQYKLFDFQEFYLPFLLFYTPTALFLASEKPRAQPGVTRIIEAAGNMTYSSYLMHFPIQLAIALVYSFMNVPIPFYSRSFFMAYISFVLTVSYFVYRYFEAPAQSFIRRKLL